MLQLYISHDSKDLGVGYFLKLLPRGGIGITNSLVWNKVNAF